MRYFVCPVCGTAFSLEGRSLRCRNGHTFDLARQGYVNLLRSQSSGKARHGDDKRMVAARTSFLDSGYYDALRDRIVSLACEALTARREPAPVCLDAGCGEGFYSSHLRHVLEKAGFSPLIAGMDISKDALCACARRDRAIELAVGSLFSIPAADHTTDLIFNLFAPNVPSEFFRILKEDGLLLRAFPAPRHLWELKEIVYDKPYENEIDTLDMKGFSMLGQETLSFPLLLPDSSSIQALFQMTPYYYKTSAEGQARLAALSSLETHAEFYVVLYRKNHPDSEFNLI